MAVRIANLKILVSANTRGLVTGFNKGKKQVSGFRANILSARKSVSSIIPTLAVLAAATLTLATVTRTARAAVRELAEQFTELDKLGKTASKIGVTTAALQKMRFAASLTGVSIETTDMALQRWTKNVAKAANGSTELAKIFTDDLKLSAESLLDLPLEEQMKAFADALKDNVAPAHRVRVIAQLLDSEGVALVNTLQQGSEALDEMFKERGELGLFTDQQIKNIESANDSLTRIGIQVNFIKGAIAAELSKVVGQLADDLVDLGKDGEASFEGMTTSVKAFTLGVALAIDKVGQLASKFNVAIPSGKIARKFAKEFGSAFLGGIKNIIGAEGTPTVDAVQAFFDRMDERIDKTRDRLSRGGGILPDAAPGAGATLPAALERGSAAAFSFLAKSGTRGKDLAEVVRNGELQITALDRITFLLQQLVKKQQGKLEVAPL